jgi:hypothetical protein
MAGLIEFEPLDHRAHGAIEEHDALGEQTLEPLDTRATLGFVTRLERKRHGGDARAVVAALLALTVGARRSRAGTSVCWPVSAAAHAVAPAEAAGARGNGRNPSA